MTERQIMLAYEAILRSENLSRLSSIIDMNAATNGGKEAKRLIKKLEEGSN